jgi:hypothetical protein
MALVEPVFAERQRVIELQSNHRRVRFPERAPVMGATAILNPRDPDRLIWFEKLAWIASMRPGGEKRPPRFYPKVNSRSDELLGYVEAGRNRWTALRKVAALTIVRSNILGVEEFCRRFDVSPGELESWALAFDANGAAGLLITKKSAVRRSFARRAVGSLQ